MVRKTSPILFAMVAAVLLLAPNAKAEIENQDYGADDPCFSANYSWGDCWTEASWTGPTTTQCVAYQSNKQACRNCVATYTNDGQPTGNQVCAFVLESSACSCNRSGTPYCSNQGSCTFYAQ